jgi:hypothetical protein
VRNQASRYPHPEKHRILVQKNPAEIDIFVQITPFRRTPTAAGGNIDENGALPYKPRQPSAMARIDRGGSIWAGKRPALGRPASADLPQYQANCHIRQIVISGKLSA